MMVRPTQDDRKRLLYFIQNEKMHSIDHYLFKIHGCAQNNKKASPLHLGWQKISHKE